MKFKIQNDMRNDSFLDNLLPVAVAAPAVAIRLNSDPFLFVNKTEGTVRSDS